MIQKQKQKQKKQKKQNTFFVIQIGLNYL